jgi:voltage-gated potassium channel
MRVFEHISIAIFTIEYVLRVTLAPMLRPDYVGIRGRLRYMCTPVALIDGIILLPLLLPYIVTYDLIFLRVFRLMRIFLILRLGRWSEGLRILGVVLQKKSGELMAVLMVTGVILLMASSIMYFLERDAQPTVFTSIPASLWWGIITLTTVGYGDSAPITGMGRIIGGIIALMGVGLGALPAGIIASGMHDEMQERKKQKMQKDEDKDVAKDSLVGDA